MFSTRFFVVGLLACVPIAAYAESEPTVMTAAGLRADTAIKIDLVKSDLALSQHNPNAAVEALSDATKYFAHASDEVIQLVQAMNQKVLGAITTDKQIPRVVECINPIGGCIVGAPVPSEPGTHEAPPVSQHKASEEAASKSKARHPQHSLPLGYRNPKDWPYPGGVSAAVHPNEHLKDYVVPDTRKGWLPGQSEAPPGVTPAAPAPPPGFVDRLNEMAEKEHKTWLSYPYPH